MQANTGLSAGDADRRQIETLCDDLAARIETVQEEQALLGQLVAATAPVRPNRARQYRSLLDEAHERYQRLLDLVVHYCGRFRR